MKAETSILELAERFSIEASHTRHVSRLAMELLDGFSPIKGLKKGDRNLLFAAASLHDIAYATNPQNHVLEGARILAGNPIDAVTENKWLMVIGIVLLHKRDRNIHAPSRLLPIFPKNASICSLMKVWDKFTKQ